MTTVRLWKLEREENQTYHRYRERDRRNRHFRAEVRFMDDAMILNIFIAHCLDVRLDDGVPIGTYALLARFLEFRKLMKQPPPSEIDVNIE